ncbi:MAG: transposase [Paracoccus sp. (in: a-proteobacteria)]
MGSHQRGGHTVWDCKYHLTWIAKYRYEVLGEDVGDQWIRETARAHEIW